MKNRHILYLFAALLFATLTKAQMRGVRASLETDLVNYTVTAQVDTTSNRKIILLVTDTLAPFCMYRDNENQLSDDAPLQNYPAL
jgi:hypothetical protein